jgi:hypothetical protein
MLQTVITLVNTHLSQLPDQRKASPNLKYSVRDAALSAFAVFVMQAPSFLAHQRDMERLQGRSNAQSLFQVEHIPSDNQIRNILDPVPASQLSELFWQIFAQIQASGLLQTHVGLDNHLLCALDGVYYFSSEQIHCANCTRMEHDGRTRYAHSLIAPVLVAPGVSQVFSLAPEFIQPQDGHDKQDCEQAAVQRWLAQQARHLPLERTTFLADDLHCKQPFIEALLALGSSFILVCLPASHETLYREIDLLAQAQLLETHQERHWNGRFHERRRYRFTNGVPLRAGGDALLVNWCEVTILNEQSGEQIYTNTFVTNHRLTNHTAADVVRCGRARWKTENENHNTLKNRGYHLEHNFGHGKQYLSSLLVALNLLAFLLHTLLWLTEPAAQAIRAELGNLQTFWTDVRTLTRYFYYPSWSALFTFMATQLERNASPPN